MNRKLGLKLILVITVIFYSCSSVIKKDRKQKNDIKALRVSQNFPIIDRTGKLLRYDTFNINIYYRGNQVLFNDFYHWDSIVETAVIKSEIRQNFFVYTKYKRYGYFYDKHQSLFDKKVLIDSMLQKLWLNKFNFYQIFTNNTVTQISQNKNTDLNTVEVFYTIKDKKDTTFSGSIFLNYKKKLKGIDYSLSKELDTIKNMKLYKIKIINNPRYIKDYKITLDKVEQIFNIDDIKIADMDELVNYFEREKKNNK